MMRPLCLLAACGLVIAGASRCQAQPPPKFLHRTAAEWAAQLRSAEPAARRNAAFALGKMGRFAAQALPELKQVLRVEKDPKVREALVAAAGEIAAGTLGGDPDLEGALIEGLRDPDRFVRRSSACALGQIAGKGDVVRAALTQALRDPEQIVRQNAAWALGQLDEKSLPALVQALGDATSDSLVKRDAANALFQVGKNDPDAMRPAMASLLAMCRDRDPEVRKAGLVPLVKIVRDKDGEALPVLKAALRDPDAEVRRYAALALSNVGGAAASEAVPVLVDALRNGEPHLKRSAAVALHNIGEVAAAAVPELMKALQDPDPELRKGAALALGGIGARAADAVPWLVHLLTNAQQPLDVRIEAAEALTGMGNIPAVQQKMPQILQVLGDPNEEGDLRIRLAWLFNDYIKHAPTMQAAFPVMSKVCAEPATKENGSVRYHCAFLLSLVYRQNAPDAALNVLSEWLHDDKGKLYGRKQTSVGATGTETQGGAAVQAVLQGDSRIMAVDALIAVGPARVTKRNDIVQQLRTLAADNTTVPELRKETKRLLTILNQ